MKFFKKLLKASLIVFLSTSVFTPGTVVSFQQEGEVRLFYDEWVPVQITKDGKVKVVKRVTHCKKPGTNCIIGPTITI